MVRGQITFGMGELDDGKTGRFVDNPGSHRISSDLTEQAQRLACYRLNPEAPNPYELLSSIQEFRTRESV